MFVFKTFLRVIFYIDHALICLVSLCCVVEVASEKKVTPPLVMNTNDVEVVFPQELRFGPVLAEKLKKQGYALSQWKIERKSN